MLFTFNDIQDKFEKFLINWFVKKERLKPVYDLYFSAFYNPYLYPENRFLSFIQAIESYHRLTKKNYQLSEKEHKERMDDILGSVPEKYSEWLSSKLLYSNEPSLRHRLKEIFREYADIIGNIISNKEAFINKVITTRNYLTHYDPKIKNESADGEELYYITEALRFSIKGLLLKELGFDLKSINLLISRNFFLRRSFENLISKMRRFNL